MVRRVRRLYESATLEELCALAIAEGAETPSTLRSKRQLAPDEATFRRWLCWAVIDWRWLRYKPDPEDIETKPATPEPGPFKMITLDDLR